eukprot:TRINITY_DN5333_c0_g2_i2.p1 TRINITY_DN5333_c0_g2~~TRINITY_DN5333_c0_g2_i2.p1  ORF type:complete len:123 (-),score=9.27 TRINITY_DN5333_c0_g2_i2:25-393(-)
MVGAAVSAGASALLFGEMNTKIPVLGQKVPVPLVMAGIGGASMVAADIVHEYVLPHLNKDKKMQNNESLAVGATGAALGTLALYTVLGGSDPVKGEVLGAGSFLASEAIYSKVLGEVSEYGL